LFLANDSVARGEFRDYRAHYLGALVDNHANMTSRFITGGDDKQTDYKPIGFDILWNGIIR